MKSSKLVTSAVLGLLALVTAVRPGTAQCPQLEPIFSIAGVTGAGSVQTSVDQATLGLNGCAILRFVIVSQPGSHLTNVTANTTFLTDPTRGTVSGNVFCVSPADCGHQFPVYGIYHDPCSGTNLVATVHITVAPCPIAPAAATCPQIEATAYIRSVTGAGSTKTSSSEATLGIPGCVFVGLVITRQSGGNPAVSQDVTFDANTTFSTDVVPGIITHVGKNEFCTAAAATACGHEFPIYATFHDVCTGTTITSPVEITIAPCPEVQHIGCPQFEQTASFITINGVATTGNPDQATLSVGQCATIRVIDVFQPGGPVDETFDVDTHFVSDHGVITGNQICVGPADANHQFTVYAIYREGCTNTTITSTLHITVRPLTPG